MKFAYLTAGLLAVLLFADLAAAQCPGGRCSTLNRPKAKKVVAVQRVGFFGRLFGR